MDDIVHESRVRSHTFSDVTVSTLKTKQIPNRTPKKKKRWFAS